MCSHLHLVALARELLEKVTTDAAQIEEIEASHSSNVSWDEQFSKLLIHVTSTIQLQMQYKIPYAIPVQILNKADELDWGRDELPVFAPLHTECMLCSSILGAVLFPQGCNKSNGNGILLTNRFPFKPIEIKIKKCSNVDCGAINQLLPYEKGLLTLVILV